MFIDTHCHVYSEYYPDVKDVLTKAKADGIEYVISAAVDKKTSKELLELSKIIPDLYINIGIHPESADDYSSEDINFIEDNIINPKVVAIGEIGLDYHYDNYDKQKQLKLFNDQLLIAEKYNLPVVVHSREATLDTINTLKKYNVRGIIHSFSGSKEIAKEYINMGFKLGINGVVTFKNANIKNVIKDIGIENFVLETDSPYLTPEPFRGKTNYPGNITWIVQFMSQYLGISFEEISKVTNKNAHDIFKIPMI